MAIEKLVPSDREFEGHLVREVRGLVHSGSLAPRLKIAPDPESPAGRQPESEPDAAGFGDSMSKYISVRLADF